MNPQINNADLHLHTIYSDGYCSPLEIIELVAARGLTAISITDHDEVSAIPEAIDIGKSKGVEIIPGVELSVCFNNRDVHILAYCFDYNDQNFLNYLSLFQNKRISRAQTIVEKLDRLGMPISFDAVMNKAGKGSVGRPHIASVLLEDGFVYSFQEAFDKYLGTDKPAHIDKYKIDLSTALRVVRAAGGVCVVAHPAINLNRQDLVQLVESGIQGIEVVHPKHSPDATQFYTEFAKKHGLLVTGGSDFHGGSKGEDSLGKYSVDYKVVTDLRNFANNKPQVV